MRNPAFIALLREIEALHDSKSHDYAGVDPLANLRMCESMGIPAWKGVIVRLTDKWSRLQQLASGKAPKHESMRDTLIDNAVYSLLCVTLLDEAASASSSRPVLADETVLAETQTVVFGEMAKTFGPAFDPHNCTVRADIAEPVGQFGWTIKDEHKM